MMIARGGGETGWEKKKKRVGTSRRGKPRLAVRTEAPRRRAARSKRAANLGPCEKVTIWIPTSSHAGRALARALAPRGLRSYRGERTRPCRLPRPPRTSTR